MEGLQEVLYTVCVMAACIVFLSKQAVDAYKKKKAGPASSEVFDQFFEKINELHRWHKPIYNPATGQPKFMWYENSAELQQEMKDLRACIKSLQKSLDNLSDKIAKNGGP